MQSTYFFDAIRKCYISVQTLGTTTRTYARFQDSRKWFYLGAWPAHDEALECYIDREGFRPATENEARHNRPAPDDVS